MEFHKDGNQWSKLSIMWKNLQSGKLMHDQDEKTNQWIKITVAKCQRKD